ncbi:hypothetical protein JCM8115_004841 [Rhodotorula mucilaginosa]
MRIATSLFCILVGSMAVQATEEGSPDGGYGGYGWRYRNRQRPTDAVECTNDHSTPREYPTEITYPDTSTTSTSTATTTSRARSSTSRSSTTTTRSPAPTGAPTGGPYTLTRSYSGSTFFDDWMFFQEVDPTEGQVNYVSREEAEQAGLISADEYSATMRVDNQSKLGAGENRKSVRIESAEPVEIGSLVLADIIRMPWGCGTWPAWWSYGEPNWPAGGEIDVIEGVNLDAENMISLHTDGDGGSAPSNPDATGALVGTECAVQGGNAGCSYRAGKASYGQEFNAGGGGVIATLFTEDEISIWFFPRAEIPDNISQGAPDRSTWGPPTATWTSSSCDIARMFSAQRLIFNITLCGEYAGLQEIWQQSCGNVAATCSEYLMEPSNFDEAIWEIKSVHVFSVE